MYHSITFKSDNALINEKNTWTDWHLVPVSRPVINPPKVKTRIVDIPGGNGSIDLTETLTGRSLYYNRTGSLEFIVVNDTYEPVNDYIEWSLAYSNIVNAIHGRKLKAILEDDPDWYYEGRFFVNEWRSNRNHSSIVIEYDLNPYKWRVLNTIEDPLTMAYYKDISFKQASTITRINTLERVGYSSVSPILVVNSEYENTKCRVRFYVDRDNTSVIDYQKTLPIGTHELTDLVIPSPSWTGVNSKCEFYGTGSGQPSSSVIGTFSFYWRRGSL